MNELDVVRQFDFDWAVALSEIWSDSVWDVAGLHAATRRAFVEQLHEMRTAASAKSPLGWVILGRGGSGKTHLLGRFRQMARDHGAAFVLVDMTDVRDFWDTVLQGFLDSLQQPYQSELFQHQCVVRNLIERCTRSNKPAAEILEILSQRKSSKLAADIQQVLGVLRKIDPRRTGNYQDVIRALICLNSDDFTISSLGLNWLQGLEIEGPERSALGFTAASKTPVEIVEALSWFMSLGGPTVLAFDQLDAIVTLRNASAQGALEPDERNASWAIIQQIGAGLGSLRDKTCNTLPVVSCLETSWDILKSEIPHSFLDRFEQTPRRLDSLKDRTIAESLVRNRVNAAFAKLDFNPPHATWPFRPEFFDSLQTNTPREILKLCDQHKKEWLTNGAVSDVGEPGARPGRLDVPTSPDNLHELDRRFSELRTRAGIPVLLEEKHEDERLAPLLQSAMQCLVREISVPDAVGVVVEKDFTGGNKTKPLHVRLRLIHHQENEREEHFCLRAVQLTNARAYQTRLKAAMTQAGIDHALRFRRLSIVRTTPTPGGAETKRLTEKFRQAGGLFLNPSEDELRTLHAVHCLKEAADPRFDTWLMARKPISQLAIIRQAVPRFPLTGGGEANGSRQRDTKSSRQVDTNDANDETVLDGNSDPRKPATVELPLGRRLVGGNAGDPMSMPLALLEKHTVILAGAGSGKTVLLRRLVEEAALLGIPSIVIDCANDLAAFGDRWPPARSDQAPDDVQKTRRYHESVEVLVWTPGKESGRPLALEPLPDLAAVSDDAEELESAIAMARESLDPIVAAGQSAAAQNKQGILSRALRSFAKNGGGKLDGFIGLLEDLPAEAGLGILNESRLARQMADALRAARERNPLLRSTGAALDPATLLGDGSAKTRISVINFIGLQTLESQRLFLAQLAMTLFGWIKKHPDPGGRALRGLLVIDEARDFVPSQKASTCKEGLMRLTAQARKYHLGLIFATQNPKDIENKIIANCSTHFYGKMNSPTSIEVIRELIAQKGGSGEDVPRLGRGEFYVHNADLGLRAPVKLATPLCLSRHPDNPLDESQILERARAGA